MLKDDQFAFWLTITTIFTGSHSVEYRNPDLRKKNYVNVKNRIRVWEATLTLNKIS